jgi:RecA/RadA recombinase
MAKSTESNDFFRNMVKELGDVDTHIADDGANSSEFSGTIDTGSYILNAALSGSIYGGVPNNKIIAFAGESATGKTFFVLGLMKRFLDDNPTGGVIYYDTEAAVTKEMMVDRGIDTKRVIISEMATVEGFRTHVSRTLDRYTEASDRPPMLLVLDSLGQLSTEKETGDITEGKSTRDMTRAQLIRGTFRALSLKLARANCALIVTNHVGDQIGAYMPTKVMGGGAGLVYAASQIVFLSKKKDRDGTEVIGNIIHCKMQKSRFTKENKMVDVRLSYDRGLDRYYGLLDLAEKYDIIKKVSTRYELPDGTKVFGKAINENPESVYTKDILDKLDEAAAREFKYGRTGVTETEDHEASDDATEAA